MSRTEHRTEVSDRSVSDCLSAMPTNLVRKYCLVDGHNWAPCSCTRTWLDVAEAVMTWHSAWQTERLRKEHARPPSSREGAEER